MPRHPLNDGPSATPDRSCAVCGAPLSHARAKFCGSRCKQRSYAGLGAAPVVRRYSVPLTHPGWSVEACPKCGYPEADGGACADCGWTLPRPGRPGGWTLHPAGTLHGPVYDKQGRREITQRHPSTNGAQRPAAAA
jgi:ribosomal protein L32